MHPNISFPSSISLKGWYHEGNSIVPTWRVVPWCGCQKEHIIKQVHYYSFFSGCGRVGPKTDPHSTTSIPPHLFLFLFFARSPHLIPLLLHTRCLINATRSNIVKKHYSWIVIPKYLCLHFLSIYYSHNVIQWCNLHLHINEKEYAVKNQHDCTNLSTKEISTCNIIRDFVPTAINTMPTEI